MTPHAPTAPHHIALSTTPPHFPANAFNIWQVSTAATPLPRQKSHMSVDHLEICNGLNCFKCATLHGTRYCAERAQAPGTTYLEFQELTPDYEADLKRRFANVPPIVVAKIPSTTTASSTTAAPVFRVEGFPGFEDHVTAPPREILQWSVEDINVKQEYVVDQTSGQLFEKTPVYKHPNTLNVDSRRATLNDSDTSRPNPLQNLPEDPEPEQSANDLVSALGTPEDDTQTKKKPSTLLTSIREGPSAETSSQQTPPLQTTEFTVAPVRLTSTTTDAPSSGHKPNSTQIETLEQSKPAEVTARSTGPASSTELSTKTSNSTKPEPSPTAKPVSHTEGSGLSSDDIGSETVTQSIAGPQRATTVNATTPLTPPSTGLDLQRDQ